MSTTITPEQFMATQQPDEDDVDETLVDPLASIAESLRTLVTVLTPEHLKVRAAVTTNLARVAEISREEARGAVDESVRRFGLTEDELQGRYDSLDRAYEELARDFDALQAKLDQVLTIVKPSTSKLANAIRAVLEPAAVEVPAPADDAPVEPPADDAPVEEWRAFGERRGLDLTDNLNRSQIRSALGIPQPAEVSA